MVHVAYMRRARKAREIPGPEPVVMPETWCRGCSVGRWRSGKHTSVNSHTFCWFTSTSSSAVATAAAAAATAAKGEEGKGSRVKGDDSWRWVGREEDMTGSTCLRDLLACWLTKPPVPTTVSPTACLLSSELHLEPGIRMAPDSTLSSFFSLPLSARTTPVSPMAKGQFCTA